MQERSDIARLLGLARRRSRSISCDSEALAGNPLGDPAKRPVVVYLPPGYDAQGSRRYPAFYVLHGYTGDVAALISSRPWETNVLQWADRLIRERRMPPALARARRRLHAVGRLAVRRLDSQRQLRDLHRARRRRSRRPQLSHDRRRRRARGLGKILGRLRRDASGAGASRRLRRVRVAQRRLVLSLRAPAGVRDRAAHARSA